MRRLAHQSQSVALGGGGRFKAVREVQDDLGRDGMLTTTIAREARFDLVMEPTADAVGYRLSVLRTCRGSHGRTRSHGEGDEDIAAPFLL